MAKAGNSLRWWKKESVYTIVLTFVFTREGKTTLADFKNSVLFVSGSSTEEIEARLFRSDLKLTARIELTG